MPTINARPGRLDIVTTAGDDLSVVLTHVDELGAAEAVAASWTCEVLDRAGGTVLASPTVTRSGGSDNILTIALADVTTGQRACVWRLHDATNDRAWLGGLFTVEPVGTGTSSTQTNAATVQVTSTAVTVTVLGAASGGGGGASAAADVSFTPTGSIAATNVQSALAEVASEYAAADTALDGRLDTLEAISIATDAELAAAISAHESDTTNVHGIADTTLLATKAEAILDALIDAKGDLIVGTAADTPARLAVGTDTHVLTADSTQATGVKWAAAAGGGAPTDATYVTLSANGSLSAEAVLGTSVIAQGNRSSLPAAATAGKLYVVDDDGQATDDAQGLLRDDGATWQRVAMPYVRSQFGGTPTGTLYPTLPGVAVANYQTGTNSTANLWCYERCVITEDSSCTGANIYVSLAGTGLAYLGLWEADDDWIPRALVKDFGTVSIASTGSKTAAVTAFTIRPGRYIKGWNGATAIRPLSHIGSSLGSAHPADTLSYLSASQTAGAPSDPAYITSLAAAGGVGELHTVRLLIEAV